jgi:hypothetical protein
METLMDKKLIANEKLFSIQNGDNLLELREALDTDVLVVSMKRNKDHMTTSLSKADLYILLEFLKTRGIK